LKTIRSLTEAAFASVLLVAWIGVFSHAEPASGAAASHCQETQLDVKWISGGAGLGHIAELIVIKNIGANNCTLRGYPSVTMTGGPSVVASVARKTRTGYLGGLGGPNAKVPLPVVTLRAHGGTASSMVEGGDVPIGNAVECVIFNKVSIVLPNLSPPYHYTTRFSGCVRPQVHPIVKGSKGSSGK
jgi:hypothetical protein